MELILDYLLENTHVLYLSLFLVILLSFGIFYKLNNLAIFGMIIFVSLKLVVIGKLMII